MKTRTLGLLLAGLALLSSCTQKSEEALMCIPRAVPSQVVPPSEPCDSFTSSFALKNPAGMANSSFARGEAVTLELKITNNASSTKSLQVPDGCAQVQLEVDSNDPVCRVYSNAADGPCTQVVMQSSYAPGETKTFTAQWPQTGSSGRPAASGSYTAYAIDRTQCGARFFASQSLTVR
ncbi:MAG: BsuPI-related putative proteinase inhibitor [Pseudomonadota bacterium]